MILYMKTKMAYRIKKNKHKMYIVYNKKIVKKRTLFAHLAKNDLMKMTSLKEDQATRGVEFYHVHAKRILTVIVRLASQVARIVGNCFRNPAQMPCTGCMLPKRIKKI